MSVEETGGQRVLRGIEKGRRIDDYLDKFLAEKKQSGERFTSKEICNKLRLTIPNFNLENIEVINKLLELVEAGKIEKDVIKEEASYYIK